MLRLLRNRFLAFTYLEFGQIDWQNVGFWHQKLEISGFCDSVCVIRNSLMLVYGVASENFYIR